MRIIIFLSLILLTVNIIVNGQQLLNSHSFSIQEIVVSEVATFSESFTGVNGTSISGKVSDSGDTWTLQTGSLTISNNAIKNPVASAYGIATFDKGWADVSVSLDCFGDLGADETGFVFRYTDINNHWKVVFVQGGNGFRIVQRQGGVDTNRKFLAQTGGHLEVRVSGDKVTAWANGHVIEYTGINAMNPGSTIHGIVQRKNIVSNPGTIDNFVLWQGASYIEPANPVHPIVLTTPSSYEVFQRNGTTADIIIEGKLFYDGSAHDIEASWNGGPYQIIAANRKQSFSGRLFNQFQGQGTLTVRLVDNITKSATASRVGIGDVFVNAGQSNASGLISPNNGYSHATLAATNFGNSYKWMNLTDPVDQPMGQMDAVSNGSPDASGSYWPLMATSFMADQNVPFALIPCSAGGTSILMWQKGANAEDRNTLFGSMIYRVRQMKGGIKAVMFHQGESDVTTNGLTPPATYEARLTQFVNDVWNELGVPVVISKIHKWDGAPTTTQTDVDNLHARVDNVVAALPGKALLGANFDKPTRVTGGLHLTTTAEATEARNRLWDRVKLLFYTP